MKYIALLGVSLVAMSGVAHAGGFSIREQSAEGLGEAFAGMAAGGDGLSSLFWNPATSSLHNDKGYISESNVSLILPYSEATNGAGIPGNPDSGNIGVNAVVPSSYATYGLTDDLTLGFAFNAPFGLATDAQPWKGSPNGDYSSVVTYNFNPSIAYKLGNGLTVAAGVTGEYLAVDLTSQTPAGTTILDASGNNIAFGYSLGVLLQPSDNLELGIGFRSTINHGLQGTARVAGPYSGPIVSQLATPEMVSVGARYQATDDLKLMAGFEWYNWSRFQDLTLKTPGGTVLGSTPEKWNNSWFASLGAEYAASDRLTLRGGAGYEASPVPDATRTPRLPDTDRIWLSAGASYKFSDKVTGTVGYSHVFMNDGVVALTPPAAPAPLTATFQQHIDILSASFSYDW